MGAIITFERLNRILNSYYRDRYILDTKSLNEHLIAALKNERSLSRLIKSRIDPLEIAVKALVHTANVCIALEAAEIRRAKEHLVVRWLIENGNGTEELSTTVEYINNEREEYTMNNNIESINITEEIICSECGCIIEGDVHEIDGEYYCEECLEDNFVQCVNCGDWIRNYDAHSYGYNNYCEDCFNDHFAMCPHCNDYEPIDEMTMVDGRWVCDYCLHRYYTECERCGEWIPDEDVYTVNVDADGEQESWCHGCFEYNTWECNECGEIYSDNVNDNGCWTCDNCHCGEQDSDDIEHWRAPRGVQRYAYKPDACFCPSYDSDVIYYGFELEAESHGNDSDDWANEVNDTLGYTYVKRDGSLNDGMEIVSHPATIEYHLSKREEYTELFRRMRRAGWRSHDDGTCGLHVHISLKPMEERNDMAVSNLLLLFDRFWDNLVNFSRRKEEQLHRWAKRYPAGDHFYKDIKSKAKGRSDRYMAINLENRHTVEVRMFRGTLNPDTFFATLQLVDVLVNAAIDLGDDENAVMHISWNELVKSDHAELNAYLEKRHLLNIEEDDILDDILEEAVAEAVEAEIARELNTGIRELDGIRVGETVVVNDDYNIADMRGMIGDVVYIHERNSIAVAFPGFVGHNAGGFAPESNGWYFTSCDIHILPF